MALRGDGVWVWVRRPACTSACAVTILRPLSEAAAGVAVFLPEEAGEGCGVTELEGGASMQLLRWRSDRDPLPQVLGS